jgi:DNA repair protein RAD50
MKTRIANLQAQVSHIDKMLADSQAVLRNLQDNLRLRSEKRSLESIDSQIDELDEDGARKAYRKFETDYNEQRRKQTEMQAEVRDSAHPREAMLTLLASTASALGRRDPVHDK